MSTTTTYSLAYRGSSEAAPKRKGLLRRFLDRLIEARMARAAEYIRQHSHLIPRELEQQSGWRVTERSESSLPFIR